MKFAINFNQRTKTNEPMKRINMGHIEVLYKFYPLLSISDCIGLYYMVPCDLFIK